MSMETNYHEWQIDPVPAFSGGIGLDYFFSDHIGVGIGAGYGYFATTYSLNGNFSLGTSEQPILFYDINNDPFIKHINSAFDSTIKISYIQFPLQVTGLTGKPQKTGVFMKAEIIASVLLDAKYEFTGNSYYWGEYVQHLPPDDSVLVPEYGHYEMTDHKGEVSLKRFVISGSLSAGISIPLAYFTTLQIGPVFHFSITDLAEKSDYYDIFGNKYDHKPVSLNYLGLEICIRFL